MSTNELLDRYPALHRLRLSLTARRIPFVQQLSATECGAACLTMVLGYLGKTVRLDAVRELMGVGRDGLTALAIRNAARSFGLRGRGVRIEVEDLKYLEPGTILHWEFNHFVVFAALHTDGAEIVDPAYGRRRVPLAQLQRSFTGVALLLEPGEGFTKEEARGGHLLRYLRQVLGPSDRLPRILVTSLMVQVFALGLPALTGALVDRVVPRGDYHLLAVLAAGLSMLVGFHFLASMIRAHLLLHLRTHLDARMTLGFLDHLVELPYGFFQRRSAGDLMMRLNSNATVREILTAGSLSGLLDGTLVVLYLLILLAANLRLGALVVTLGAAQLLVFVFSRRRQRELLSQDLETQARSQSYQIELFSGIETLKAMGGEHRAVEHWSHLFVDVLNLSLARGRLAALLDSLNSTLRLLSPLLILGYGTLQVLGEGMSLGTMLGLSALAQGFLGPLGSLVATFGQLELLRSYIERISDVMDTPPEQDRAQVRPASVLRGEIELERVSFQYGPAAPPVVRDVSLTIEPGHFVALVGRSGSGKSTLASLLLGLYQPASGRIRYDGTDLAELDLGSVRRQLGIVTQKPYLFGTTIRSNIAFSDPQTPLEAVVDAARRARLHDEIMAMPMRYETLLIDQGASLSGGQRQRLALARALLRSPAILLLDEATSALDAVTEAEVQAELSRLRCTRIVIAHRLSTIVHADLILVMEEGRVVERGTHAELLRHGGVYARLVAAQVGEKGPCRG